MAKRLFIFLFFTVVFISQVGYAQLKAHTAVVKGHVIDSKSKVPVPYAIIRIKKTGKYVMSDKNGDFEMQIPKLYWRNKEIKLEVKANNYSSHFIEFDTKKHKETKVLLIRLKKD